MVRYPIRLTCAFVIAMHATACAPEPTPTIRPDPEAFDRMAFWFHVERPDPEPRIIIGGQPLTP